MNISVDLIKNLPLFSKLSDGDIAEILPIFKLLNFTSPGAAIFQEGNPGDALYLILEGEVEIRKNIDSASVSDKSLAILPAGTFFGEMALLTGEMRSANAFAKTDKTCLLQVPRDEFLHLMAIKPDVAALLMAGLVSILSERLRATSLEAVTLYETGRIVSSTTSHYELSRRILERLVKTLGACSGIVLLWNEIVECFECHAALPEMPVTISINSHCALSRFIQKLSEPMCELYAKLGREAVELGIDRPSVIFVPLITSVTAADSGYQNVKRVTGVIILTHDVPDYFKLPHMNLLQGVAGQVSQALLSGKLLQENESRRTYGEEYVTPAF